MKYDEQFFGLSAEAYNKFKPKSEDAKDTLTKSRKAYLEERDSLQKKLLKKLFKRLKKVLDVQDHLANGVLKFAYFNDSSMEDDMEGFQIIDKLARNCDFTDWASEYCLYISNVGTWRGTDNRSFYELSWDYRTYFEGLQKEHQEEVDRKKRQVAAAKAAKKREYCKMNGHNYGEWKEKRWTSLEEYGPSGIESLFTGHGTTEVEHVNWTRSCKNCGAHQTRQEKPLEVEKQELEKRLQALQKRIDRKKG